MAKPDGLRSKTNKLVLHAKDMVPQQDFDRQQPIINELVARFNQLQNKRESFKAAAQRPMLPPPKFVLPSIPQGGGFRPRSPSTAPMPIPHAPFKQLTLKHFGSGSMTLERPKPSQEKPKTSQEKPGSSQEKMKLFIESPASSREKLRPVGDTPASSLEKSKPVETPMSSEEKLLSSEEKHKTRPVLTMEAALANENLRAHFRDFVEAAFAVENLDFYEAVEDFETLANDRDRFIAASKIVDMYVRDTSPNQVNLPSALATKLAASVDAKQDFSKLMTQAKHEILNLMQTNFLNKFLSVVGQPAFVPDDSDDEDKEEDKTEKKAFFKDWVKRTHPKTGDTYYENPQTGVTMWDIPKPIGILPPPLEPPPYF